MGLYRVKPYTDYKQMSISCVNCEQVKADQASWFCFSEHPKGLSLRVLWISNGNQLKMNEVNQIQKDKCHMFFFIHDS